MPSVFHSAHETGIASMYSSPKNARNDLSLIFDKSLFAPTAFLYINFETNGGILAKKINKSRITANSAVLGSGIESSPKPANVVNIFIG